MKSFFGPSKYFFTAFPSSGTTKTAVMANQSLTFTVSAQKTSLEHQTTVLKGHLQAVYGVRGIY